MSVLLVNPPLAAGTVVIERLLAQDDEVRVVTPGLGAEEWRKLGAHVAVGESDPDLIEAAGAGTRTIVVFDDPHDDEIEAAIKARIDRLVSVTQKPADGTLDKLERSGLSYVVLVCGRKLLRRAVSSSDIAEAVDAADDIAGDVRLELDLAEPSAWSALGIAR